MAIHNLPTADGHARALDEATCLLRPKGRPLMTALRTFGTFTTTESTWGSDVRSGSVRER